MARIHRIQRLAYNNHSLVAIKTEETIVTPQWGKDMSAIINHTMITGREAWRAAVHGFAQSQTQQQQSHPAYREGKRGIKEERTTVKRKEKRQGLK